MGKQGSVEKPNIAIIGTGLIGCSMSDGLRHISGEIIGVDINTEYLQEALYRGLIDRSMSLDKAVSSAGVVIISVPVDSAIKLLPHVLDQISPQTVVIDTGSVKTEICRSVKDHPKRMQFVASHPMAGLAVSGPDAADAGLFRNRNVIICEYDKTSEEALSTAKSVFENLGLNIVFMDPELHDLCVAQVSHLPQVISYCLSALTGDLDENSESMVNIASTGFESMTRLASSPADMWIPIFQHNRENLSDSLDKIIARLSETRNMINTGHWQLLTKLIEKAKRSREIFLSAYKHA